MKKFGSLKQAKNVTLLRSLWIYRSQLGVMLKQVINGEYKLSLLTTITALGALLYIFSPIDLLPDFIPVAGWLDDGAVFYLFLKRLMNELNKWMDKNDTPKKVYVIS